MAQTNIGWKQIPEGESDIGNIPGRSTLVEVEHGDGLVLPSEIIEFKIPMNEAIVGGCHGKCGKERSKVIAFGLDSWFIVLHSIADESQVIPSGPACRYP